ncbi:MAG: DNA gyrase subunit A, partial [Ruminococcaceae bacterium]|nr:DNA gyrase subunit A [Oscillospiraceae bacterium]
NLFKQTALQSNFSIILLALVNNQKQPKILSLREILDEYLDFQKEIIVRRTRYDLRKAQERAHLLESLLIAQDHIDEVIKIIRSRYDDAKEALMERFGLDEVQAQAILDMRLKALQGLDREKLENEYKDLEERIDYYLRLLDSDEMLRQVLTDELTAIRDKYGDERRTEIQDVEDEIDIDDLIDEEDCVYTLTHGGYIKRLPTSEYRAQGRGGKGMRAMTTKEEDYVETVFTASTHDNILFFTSAGRVYIRKGYRIPEAGRSAKGSNIVNILPLQPEEKISAMIHARDYDEDAYLVFVTRNGTVKRLAQSALKNIRSNGIRALNLDEGDELISVRQTDGRQNILISTHDGFAICFAETDIRPMGRDAVGVRGIRLRDGDFVVGAARARAGGMLLSVTENGYGKRTPIEEYIRGGGEPQHRGGKGMKSYRCTEKTGPVAACKVVDENDDLLVISDDGTIIRMDVAEISVYGRDTQGVRLMRVADGSRVISIARTEKEAAEDAPAEEAPGAPETEG